MNGYISLTKEEAIEVIGMCSIIDDELHRTIMKKTVQYCFERAWFDVAFKYREMLQ